MVALLLWQVVRYLGNITEVSVFGGRYIGGDLQVQEESSCTLNMYILNWKKLKCMDF